MSVLAGGNRTQTADTVDGGSGKKKNGVCF